jgi:hypothetical protein
MFDTAANHLPLAVTFIALLIVHMLKLDACVSSVTRRKRYARPRPVFSHETEGELVLVDPDGRRSRRKRR